VFLIYLAIFHFNFPHSISFGFHSTELSRLLHIQESALTVAGHPSVSPMPMIYSNTKSYKNFKYGGDMALDTSNWDSKFNVKRSTSLGLKM